MVAVRGGLSSVRFQAVCRCFALSAYYFLNSSQILSSPCSFVLQCSVIGVQSFRSGRSDGETKRLK